MKQSFFKKADILLGYLTVPATYAYAICMAVQNKDTFFIIIFIFAVIFLIEKAYSYIHYKDEILRLNKRINEYDKQNKELKKRLELFFVSDFKAVPHYFDEE